MLYSACALNLPNGREVAWQVARRAVELAPHEPSAHAQIAEAAFPGEYGTPEELALAERALTEALRLDPHDGAIQNDLARVRLARSDSRSALAGFAGAVSADPLRVGAVAMGNVALVVSRIIVIQAAIVFGAVFVGAGLLGKSPSLAGRLVLLALVIALGGFLVVRWRGYLTGAGSRAAVKRVVLDNKRILAGALLVVAAMLALAPIPSAFAQVATREAMARFVAAFEALPPAQREAFVMKEEAGLSIAEIAAATGTGEEAVKSRVRYATAKLREALDG